MTVLRDIRGHEILLDAPPQRIVSLVPSWTETIIAFGGLSRLAGRTEYCIRPTGVVDSIPVFGGTKNPELPGIIALRPDLVIANKEENRQPDIELLEAVGIPVWVNFPETVQEALELIPLFGALAGNPAEGEECARRIQANLAALRHEASTPTPLRVLYLIWPKPLMSVGAGTYVDDYLQQGGLINVAREMEGRYPRLDRGTVAALDPDLILLPSEPYHFGEADRAEWLSYRDLRAARTGQVALVDGEHFSWYGSRMDAGFADMLRLRAAYQGSQ